MVFRFVRLGIFTLALLPSQLARAQWTETFTGGFDQAWSIFDNDGNPLPGDTIADTSSNDLRLRYDPVQAAQGNVDEFVAGLVATQSFTDVRVRSTVFPLGPTPTITGGQANANNDVFVAARSDGIGSYLLVLDYGGNGFVNLIRVEPNGDVFVPQLGDFPGQIVSGAFPGVINTLQPYDLELLVIGNQLHGNVFNVGGSIPLITLDWMDSVHPSGFSGLGVAINDDLVGAGTSTLINSGFDHVSSVRGIISDLNGDGLVDSTDLGILLNNWGQMPAVLQQGNLVNAGTTPIDSSDLGVLLNQWTGSGPAPSIESVMAAHGLAVPEPSGLLLAGLGAAAMLVVVGRRKWQAPWRVGQVS